jgi:uncharacterized OB-fold protein
MKRTFTLDYTLGEGFLAPYLDGLRAGAAVASRCAACGRVALPPEPVCDCGGRDAAMITLSGTATIILRTTGADGDVGLVRFDGADSNALARLDGFTDQTRGRVAPSAEAALVLTPEAAP